MLLLLSLLLLLLLSVWVELSIMLMWWTVLKPFLSRGPLGVEELVNKKKKKEEREGR